MKNFFIGLLLIASVAAVTEAYAITDYYWWDSSGYCPAENHFETLQEAANCSCAHSNGTNAIAINEANKTFSCVDPWWRTASQRTVECPGEQVYEASSQTCVDPAPPPEPDCASTLNQEITVNITYDPPHPVATCGGGCRYEHAGGVDAYVADHWVVNYIGVGQACTGDEDQQPTGDGGTGDSGTGDSGTGDTGTGDTGTGDTGTGDTGTGDTGTGDTGTGDTGTGDTGTGDTGTGDTGTGDTGTGDETTTEEYPAVEQPDNDQYSDLLDGVYDEWTGKLGTDDPGNPGFGNPLNIPAGGACSQVSFGIGSYMTTFPGSQGCTMLNSLKSILAWAVYVMTAFAIYHIALKRPE